MKYLIVGLGNIGDEYANTRHNVGFMTVDAFAEKLGLTFQDGRYGFTAEGRLKNKQFVLLKPSTYMNLSGMAVKYWAQKEKIELENILVIVDDLALPFAQLRLKPNGSAAGHNGLKNIQENLNTDKYARLRIGLGNDYPKGKQIDFVLGEFTAAEKETLPDRLKTAGEMIESFILQGVDATMNSFNKK